MGNAVQGPCACPGQKEQIINLSIPAYQVGSDTNGGTGASPSDKGPLGLDLRPSCCCCSDPSAGEIQPIGTAGATAGQQGSFSMNDQFSEKANMDLDYAVPNMATPLSATVAADGRDVPPIDMRELGPGEAPIPELTSPPQSGREKTGVSDGTSGSGRTANDWAKDQAQFVGLPPLPEGWIRVKSRSTGAIYYCYQETGETTFTEPTGPPESMQQGGASRAAGSGEPVMAAGWVEVMSRSTGQVYYWNATLQKSQFEFPAAGEAEESPLQPLPESDESLPTGWVAMVSRSTGKTYYFHAETQTSQFERPTA